MKKLKEKLLSIYFLNNSLFAYLVCLPILIIISIINIPIVSLFGGAIIGGICTMDYVLNYKTKDIFIITIDREEINERIKEFDSDKTFKDIEEIDVKMKL